MDDFLGVVPAFATPSRVFKFKIITDMYGNSNDIQGGV